MNLEPCCDAPRINKSKGHHKRELHLFSFMGSTIFDIGDSLIREESMWRRRPGGCREGVPPSPRGQDALETAGETPAPHQAVFSFMFHWMACCISSRALRRDNFSLMCAW